MYIRPGVTRYGRNRRGQRVALSGASDCGADQEFDANCTYAGVTGQCVPKGTAGKNSACDYSKAPSSDTHWYNDLLSGAASALTAFTKGSQSASAAPVVVSKGPSTTTLIAIGGAVVLGAVLLTRRR